MTESNIQLLEHARFGRLEIEVDALIHCDGLPGFPDAKRLALIEHDRPSWFAWLVCLEIPDIAFAVADPRTFYPDYAPKAHLSDLRAISATPDDELEILVIAKLSGEANYLNLAAPLLVNPKGRRAVQAILADGAWPLWAPLENHPTENAAKDQTEGHDPGPSASTSKDVTQMESNPHR